MLQSGERVGGRVEKWLGTRKTVGGRTSVRYLHQADHSIIATDPCCET